MQRRRMWRGTVPVLCLLLLQLSSEVDAQLRREVLDRDRQLFDLVLRNSDDPDLLTSREAAIRQKLLDAGVDPRDGRRPTLLSSIQRHLADQAGWDLLKAPRQVEILEVDREAGLAIVFRFPESNLFYSNVDTNLVGLAFEAPRDMADSTLSIDVSSLESWQRTWVAVGLQDQLRRQIGNRAAAAAGQKDLLNFTIPIQLPQTLERVIGRGDATSIRISGQLNFSIGGRSTVRDDFLGNEIQQSQSLFPSLEMQQSLRVNMDGQVGEKIKVRVRHDSDAIGAQATEVKLSFEGDEDDIIQTVRAGNIDVTLPGSRLLGVGASKGGLFGVKVEGAVGPVEFTLLTSKEQSQSNEQNFSQSGGAENEVTFDSSDYAKHRFFLLNAPVPVYFAGVNGAPSDEYITRFQPGWRIDAASLSVYKAVGPGVGDENFFDKGIAYVDTSGIGWEGYDPLTDEVVQPVDPNALLALGAKKVERDRWQRLLPDRDWTPLLDVESQSVIGVAMSQQYTDADILAVTYTIVDENGGIVRRVGRSVDDPRGPTIPRPGDNSADPEQVLFLKLLKSEGDPFDESLQAFNPTALTWEYELRNYYDLRGRDIEPQGFDIRIERKNNALENPQLAEELGSNLNWFRVFGLDELDNTGNPGHDDKPDVTDATLFNLSAGILQFPSRTPFNPSEAELRQATDDSITSLDNLATADLYTKNLTTAQDIAEAGKFRIVVKQTSVSSRLRLNAFNIQEGSEEVTLNGRVLQRNVDYTIDYFSGEVNLIGQAAGSINAQSSINVKFEVDPLFGGGRTSLSGMNLTYHIGTQNQLSTTWLLQTQPNNATKPRLGEEPSKSWVGNLSGKFHLEPGWVRSTANLLPMVDSDQDVSINLDGEVAVSVPNPNTKDVAYVEDFESVDQSIAVSMSREGWTNASLPAEYEKNRGSRDFGPEDRAYAGWHRAVDPGVLRRHLNPDLSEQEKRDVLPSLELRVLSKDPGTNWDPNEFAGIMRPLGGEVDLSESQFLEFWLDDGTGNVPADRLPIDRPGRLHIDFGFINEDSFWKKDDAGRWVLGEFDQEDSDNDGILGINQDTRLTEDTGLDGIISSQEQPDDVLIPNRPGRNGDPAGDDFDASPGDESVFLYINGTEKNNRLDTEDLNLNGSFDRTDGYFSLTLDLADTTHALVDIYRDFADNPGFIADSENEGFAWRKYRLDLRDAVTRTTGVDGPLANTTVKSAYTRITPDLSRVRSIRIWYEDASGSGPAERRLRFTEMRFLGNRWLNDRIRTADDQVIPPAILGTEEFRLGVLNNKDNPEYRPPVFPDTRNNIAEKEQALQFVYSDLAPGHQVRARKDIPGRIGQDFTVYDELNFFWREPQSNGLPATEQMGLEAFYWLGADSLNYYEVSFAFDDVQTSADGWQEVRIDMADMTNVKFNEFVELYPGVVGSPLVQRGIIRDRVSGEPYRVTVRGRPDLTQVQRFYAGVRYPLDAVGPGGLGGGRFTGEVLFNEIRLKGVNDKIGYAQRYAGSLNIPGLADMQLEWSQTDAEFRGLNARQGSQVLNRRWSARASSRLQNFIPTFGFEIPFQLSRRVELGLPKFAPRTDIELIDPAAQDSLKTEAVSESFNFSVKKRNPSKNKLLQLLVDPFQYALSGSRATRRSPTRDTEQKSADTKINYDLRLRQGKAWEIPLTGIRLRYLPTQITAASIWRWDTQSAVDKRSDGTLIPRAAQLTKTSNNNVSVIMQPTRSIQSTFALSSNRNLILGSQKLFGLEIGQEETFNQRLSVSYKPTMSLLRWLKPDLDYKVGYSENRRPGIRQPATRSDLPGAEDGFFGRAGQVRNMSTSQDVTVKGQLDAFGWLAKKFGKSSSNQPTPATRRRDEQRRRGQLGRAGRGIAPPTTQPPVPTPDATDTTATGAGDEVPGNPEVEPSGGGETQQGFAENEPIDRYDDSDPGADDRNGFDPTQHEDESAEFADAEGDSTASEQNFAPGEALASLVRPFKNLLFNLQPVRSSWTRTRNTNYARVNRRGDAAYRFGFSAAPKLGPEDEITVGQNPDGSFVTQPFSSERREYRNRYSFSTQSQVSKDVRLDASYTRQSSSREGTQGESADFNWEVPVGLRISRVNEWRVFGDLFSSSSIDLNYRRSKRVDRIVRGQASYPNISWSLQPRWTFRFQNDLDANLNITFGRDMTEAAATIQRSRNLRANLKLQKNFDANGRLSFLRFGRQGTGTTIDMNVDIGFTSQRSARVRKSDQFEDQVRGKNSIQVNPRFSYQFNRNLRAGLQLEFSRSKDIARDTTTKSFGLFFDATLNF